MKSNTLSFFRKNGLYLLLTTGFLLAYGWKVLWADEFLLHWWRGLYGILPDGFFFQGEEFIALNSHSNSWPPLLGFWCISFVIIALSIYRAQKEKIRLGFFLFMIVLFLVCAANLLPCLCRAQEYGWRLNCQSSLKISALELLVYIQDHQSFPEALIVEISPKDKMVVTLPPDRKPSGTRFVIFEDAPRAHAGDLRHRLWSDGTIDSYYPWKTEGGAK